MITESDKELIERLEQRLETETDLIKKSIIRERIWQIKNFGSQA